jgi:FkbM family methyltransferase
MLSKLLYHSIRTPLETPILKLREIKYYIDSIRMPQLADLHLERIRRRFLLRKALKPDSNCIDIGCHYGSMLSLIIKLAPRGKHFAFEAIPEKYKFLIKKFPEVSIYGIALSDTEGTTQFNINLTATGFSGIMKYGESSKGFRVIDVPCNTLDNIIPQDQRIDFIKCVVEGAEEKVLRGGFNTIKNNKPLILFECGPGGPEAMGSTRENLYKILTDDLGYSIYTLKNWISGKQPASLSQFNEAVIYPFTAFEWIADCKETMLK